MLETVFFNLKAKTRAAGVICKLSRGVLTPVFFVCIVYGISRGDADQNASRFAHSYLIHLPGIAGPTYFDGELVRGLQSGGYDGRIEIYDWTEADPGLAALWSRQRNEREAAAIADKIVSIFKSDPLAQITVTAHSGGVGVAVWALERLPKGVQVQTMLLLSGALSPQYDLSKALRHVCGKAYSFSSVNDAVVLGAGTRMFGTIDGVDCDAAGRVGFSTPPGADPAAYQKLVPRPYQQAWIKLGNIGDHIGTLQTLFAQHVLAPLVLQGLGATITTQPTTAPAHG
jgi:hypothetical protein